MQPQLQQQLQPSAYQPLAPGMSNLPNMAAQQQPQGIMGETISGARAIGNALVESAPVKAVLTGLQSLGLYKGSMAKPKDAEVRNSILAFQRANNIPQSGVMDTATVSAVQTAQKKQAAAAGAGSAASNKPKKRLTAKQKKRLAAKRAAAKKAAAAKSAAAAAGATQATTLGATQAVGNPATSTLGMPGSPTTATLGMPGASNLGMPGLGNGLSGMGFPSPTGATTSPQMNATNQQGLANGPEGATQNVTNRNVYDSSARTGINSGIYGSPFGLTGGFGGIGGLGSGYGMGTFPYGAGLVGWQGANAFGSPFTNAGTGIGVLGSQMLRPPLG
jgi:hypothetical protein